MKYKAILFDVDGTLLDTREYIYQSFEHVFQSHGLTHLTRKNVLSVMGKPLEECYATLAPDYDAGRLCQEHRRFQEENVSLVQPFPHTRDTLGKLKQLGTKLAAVSTRKQTGLKSLEHSGVLSFLDVVITGDDVTKFKPHPEGLLKALEKLNTEPSTAAMVGDTPADIQAGKNAGASTVAATYGFVPYKQLKHSEPDFLIKDIAELVKINSLS